MNPEPKNSWLDRVSTYIVPLSFIVLIFTVIYIVFDRVQDGGQVDGKKICTREELIISDWQACQEGIEERTVTSTVTCLIPVDIELRRNCLIKQRAYLFKEDLKEYTTSINLTNPERPYINNRDNVAIKVTGNFSGATLTVRAVTNLRDGSPYKIAEYYYLFFGIEESILRVIGTSRLPAGNRLDLRDYGIFQGTETPKELIFDLKNLKLADEKNGFDIEDYVAVLNRNDGKTLDLSLFLADGRSMTEIDELKRIYGTITDAYIDYTCANGGVCKIERVPSLPVE